MNDLMKLTNVGKSFGNKVVFQNITMSINAIKPTVIMGVNGCGKSTLLKIIAGVLSHSDGEIVRSPNIKIAYAPDRFPKLPFKVVDYITHMGNIQGMSNTDIKDYIDKQFEYFTIPKHIKDQLIGKCSKGTIQKVNIMQALMSKSDLLVMDEPFSGLDEDSIEKMIDLLSKLIMDNTSVVISCHEKVLAKKVTDNVLLFTNQSLIESHQTPPRNPFKFKIKKIDRSVKNV